MRQAIPLVTKVLPLTKCIRMQAAGVLLFVLDHQTPKANPTPSTVPRRLFPFLEEQRFSSEDILGASKRIQTRNLSRSGYCLDREGMNNISDTV